MRSKKYIIIGLIVLALLVLFDPLGTFGSELPVGDNLVLTKRLGNSIRETHVEVTETTDENGDIGRTERTFFV